MKTIIYWSYGVRVEYSPHPAKFETELERLSNAPDIDHFEVKEESE